MDEAARLAAIHLALICEPGPEPTKDDVADCEGCQLPDHLRRKTTSKKWRKAVVDAYHDLRDQSPSAGEVELMLMYLKYGRAWPFYGSTFFYGYVEQPEAKGIVFRERPDELVRVGVNLDGIHVIKEKSNEVIECSFFLIISFSLPWACLAQSSRMSIAARLCTNLNLNPFLSIASPTNTPTHAHAHTHTHTRAHTHTHTHVRARTRTHTHAHTHSCVAVIILHVETVSAINPAQRLRMCLRASRHFT
jgi:hypothetical protein